MVTRRTFLRNGLVLVAGSAGLGLGEAHALPQTPGSARFAMIIDPKRCMGCNSCVAACKLQNATAQSHFLTAVPASEVGRYPQARNVFVPVNCNQCDEPPCLPACPQDAISKLANNIVATDWNRCTGDGACVDACPYNARFIDPRVNKSDKCDFCLERLANGLQPACVEACPSQARLFGDLKAPTGEFAAYLDRAGLHPRMPRLGLATNVLYPASTPAQQS